MREKKKKKVDFYMDLFFGFFFPPFIVKCSEYKTFLITITTQSLVSER